jgi:hypothetical protein
LPTKGLSEEAVLNTGTGLYEFELDDSQTPGSYVFYLKVTAAGGAFIYSEKLTVTVQCAFSSVTLSAPVVEYDKEQVFEALDVER